MDQITNSRQDICNYRNQGLGHGAVPVQNGLGKHLCPAANTYHCKGNSTSLCSASNLLHEDTSLKYARARMGARPIILILIIRVMHNSSKCWLLFYADSSALDLDEPGCSFFKEMISSLQALHQILYLQACDT